MTLKKTAIPDNIVEGNRILTTTGNNNKTHRFSMLSNFVLLISTPILSLSMLLVVVVAEMSHVWNQDICNACNAAPAQFRQFLNKCDVKRPCICFFYKNAIRRFSKQFKRITARFCAGFFCSSPLFRTFLSAPFPLLGLVFLLR